MDAGVRGGIRGARPRRGIAPRHPSRRDDRGGKGGAGARRGTAGRYRDRVARGISASTSPHGRAPVSSAIPEGGFYRPHVDRADSPAWPDAARRQVATIVFLGSSAPADEGGCFEGGVLRLYPGGPESHARGGRASPRDAGRVPRHAAPRGHRGAARRAGRDRRLVLLGSRRPGFRRQALCRRSSCRWPCPCPRRSGAAWWSAARRRWR